MPAKPERAQQPRAGQAARRKAIKILLSAAPKASALEVTLKPHFPKEVAQRHPAIRARLDKVPEALLAPPERSPDHDEAVPQWNPMGSISTKKTPHLSRQIGSRPIPSRMRLCCKFEIEARFVIFLTIKFLLAYRFFMDILQAV
jgi:hypothetical protein